MNVDRWSTGLWYGNVCHSAAQVRTSVQMFLVPANRDIVSFVHVTFDYFVGLLQLLVRQGPHNVFSLEQRFPGVDGRHAMPERLVEIPGHDDGVIRELVAQGCFLLQWLV